MTSSMMNNEISETCDCPEVQRYCRVETCGVLLEVGVNWTESRKKRCQYTCNICEAQHQKEWQRKFLEENGVPNGTVHGRTNPESKKRVRDNHKAKTEHEPSVYMAQRPLAGVIKIGYTKNTHIRFVPLNTGLEPGDEYILLKRWEFKTKDKALSFERIVHKELDECRIVPNKELFRGNPDDFTEIIDQLYEDTKVPRYTKGD